MKSRKILHDIQSRPFGYVFDNQTQHIIGRRPDGTIQELWWNGNRWSQSNLSNAVGGLTIVGNPYGFSHPKGTQHIIGRERSGKIVELWWSSSSGWQRVDLSDRLGGLTFASDPTAYVHTDGSQHIVGRRFDGAVQEFWWHPTSGWRANNLSNAVGGLTIVGNPYGFSHPKGTQHIIGRERSGKIVELWWSSSSGWQRVDLSDRLGGLTFASDPTAYVHTDGSQHIVGIDGRDRTLGHVLEFWWHPKKGWSSNSLFVAATNFRFIAGITIDQYDTLIRQHERGRTRVNNCTSLNNTEKQNLRKVYSRLITHRISNDPEANASANIGGSEIWVNFKKLFPQGNDEIAQTLIHEMMHCAGYSHPDKRECMSRLPSPNCDSPGDNGQYYGSAALRAEFCIAGRQSDLSCSTCE